MGLESFALDQLDHILGVLGLVGVLADLVHPDLRQPVAAGVVDDRTAVHVDVLQSDPSAAHVPAGLRVEVDRVRVSRLLRAPSEVEGLERQRPAAVELLQHRQDPGSESKRLDVLADPPGIHDAVVGVVDAVGLPAVLTLEQAVEVGHDSVEDGLATAGVADHEIAVPLEFLPLLAPDQRGFAGDAHPGRI